jgi:TPR repeat protein
MKRLPLAASLAFAVCGAIPAAAAADLTAVQMGAAPGANEPSNYESDYAWAARLSGVGGGTPEADARLGETYFLQGVHAFQKKDYAFAIQMYEVAASWAFKPAEYNLGVIYARGQGVPADLPRAMAWMALAAERNDARYVEAREAVYAELSKEQFEQANVIWRDLKKTYGDEVALKRAKARWAEVRSQMTGSRVGSVGNLTVGLPAPNGGDPSTAKDPGHILPPGATYVRSTVSSSAEVTGGEGIDGSIAYSQLRASDNPYDPKFDRNAIGRATVGPLKQVDETAAKKPADKSADDSGQEKP